MNYLQSNKVNYLQSSSSVITYNNGISTYPSCDYIIYNNDIVYNMKYIDMVHYISRSSTPTIIDITSLNSSCNLLYYQLALTLVSSDFITINSNDTITIEITFNDISKSYTYTVLPQNTNVYIISDHYKLQDILHSFKVKFTSTTPLTFEKMGTQTLTNGNTEIMNLILC